MICSSHGRQLKNKTVYNERSFIMSKRSKYGSDFKMKIVQEYLVGNGSSIQLGVKYDCSGYSILEWVAQYDYYGETAFVLNHHNNSYTHELKPVSYTHLRAHET